MGGPCEGGAEIAVSNRGNLSCGFASQKGNRVIRTDKSITQVSSELRLFVLSAWNIQGWSIILENIQLRAGDMEILTMLKVEVEVSLGCQIMQLE
jgi:hypothetical protein